MLFLLIISYIPWGKGHRGWFDRRTRRAGIKVNPSAFIGGYIGLGLFEMRS